MLLDPNFIIYLETYHPLYRIAYEFIISIADPLERPTLIH